MLRTFGLMTIVALLAVGFSLAQEKAQKDKAARDGQPARATITKVDPGKNSLTLKYKDREGKEVERTFDLKGDVKMFDEAGKIITIDAYRVGNQVIVIEREGRLLELRKDKGGLQPGKEKRTDK